jgi:hypothetical protein
MTVKIPIPIDTAKYISNLVDSWQIIYGAKIQAEELEDLYRLGYCEGGLAALREAEEAIAK